MFNLTKRIYSVIILSLLCISTLIGDVNAALPSIKGAGFIPSEGEYLCDQVWTNDDNVSVATELITSGGTCSFELATLGGKYLLSLYFRALLSD